MVESLQAMTDANLQPIFPLEKLGTPIRLVAQLPS